MSHAARNKQRLSADSIKRVTEVSLLSLSWAQVLNVRAEESHEIQMLVCAGVDVTGW